MTSIGENDIVVNAYNVGRVRVLNMSPDSALYPRLGLTLGITLHDLGETRQPAPKSLIGFELRDLAGELRLAENSEVVSQIRWVGPRRFVRSSNYGSENQIRCACDLSPNLIETIEERRNGGPAEFWMELWPILVGTQGHLDAEIRPFRVRPPREAWLEFIASVEDRSFDILEIEFGAREATHFRRAIGYTREAHQHVREGRFDEAVASCRLVIEAVGHEIEDGDKDALRKLLLGFPDPLRGEHYAGIVSRVKQLAGFVHHDLGRPVTFSRIEARFVIRVTEAVLMLAASATAHPGT